MTREELLLDCQREFADRRFAAGLLLAFIGFLRELDALGHFESFDEFARTHAVLTETASGKRANTLIVTAPGKRRGTLSIRPFYNAAEDFFRNQSKRFDYPNCAPHATQAWTDYVRWLDGLLRLSPEDVAELESAVREHVLRELPSHEIASGTLRPLERRFSRLLAEFDMTAHRGEPPGGAFQGALYAYIRADAPHLHLDVAKVGAGSKRLQRVGDIDGWDGERLVLSVEVKHFHLSIQDANATEPFITEVMRRQALAIVAAESLSDDARNRVAELGGRPIDAEELARLVDLWDPIKQRSALQAFVYYVCHIEKRMPLIDRTREFIDGLDE